jgi:hypothetical protein
MTEKVQNNKIIQVYDDVFDFGYRHELYCYIKKSFFKLGWVDAPTPDKIQHEFLHSVYSNEDVNAVGFFEKLKNTSILEHVVGLKHKHTVVNLSTPSDANFVHSHLEKMTILYYANLDWQDGWHGETLFYDELGKDIIFASPYTPGRIIVFDATIPHTIRPQSTLGPKFRFTLASFFDYPTQNNNEH